VQAARNRVFFAAFFFKVREIYMLQVHNPVLPGFHPDPSILQVGDDYYIANSTFEWYPGVEINRSKDLVTWEPVPSPLNERRLLDMAGCHASCGIWAPCLSYSDGLFWLIYTNVRSWNAGPWKDTPNFLTTAPSIEGPWSDPVYLDSSGFDPSLFHDDDGKKWLVNMEWDYRYTGGYQFTGILLQEYSTTEKKLVGPVRKIFPGSEIALVEGPHLYKRNGWYYIAAAEGGTGYEHALTVGRSRSITGPYELHPQNPLITSYGRPDIKIQKAGHGSWCDSPDGRTYLAFLCGRPLPGTNRCVLGRETSLAEVVWKDDWPYIKPDAGKDLFVDSLVQNFPHDTFEPPLIADAYRKKGELPPATASKTYRFDGKHIDDDFKNLRIERDPEIYSLSARPGYLRLRGGESPVSTYQQTLLARRQTDFCFAAETCVEFKPANFQQLAGLVWRYDEANQYLLSVSMDEEKGRTLSVLTMINGAFARTKEILLPPDVPVWLGVTVRFGTGQFRYSLDGKTWIAVRPVLDASVLSDDAYSLGFTGAFVGLFCVDTERYSAVADFDHFAYTVLD
jgi:xylan 1,4-beta-xylosidase